MWISRFHCQLPQKVLARAIFDPLPYDETPVMSYWNSIPHLPPCLFYDWRDSWDGRRCFGVTVVWFPPPEIARQCIYFMLETWCERPLDTAALFFVPHKVPAFWWGLSKYIVELPSIYPHLTPLRLPSILPIPVTVSLIPCHKRVLPDLLNRLERSSPPTNLTWHRQQAEHVRGLLPVPIPKSL